MLLTLLMRMALDCVWFLWSKDSVMKFLFLISVYCFMAVLSQPLVHIVFCMFSHACCCYNHSVHRFRAIRSQYNLFSTVHIPSLTSCIKPISPAWVLACLSKMFIFIGYDGVSITLLDSQWNNLITRLNIYIFYS